MRLMVSRLRLAIVKWRHGCGELVTHVRKGPLMKRMISILLVLFAGCSTIPQADLATDQPELISSVPLPSYPASVPTQGLRMNTLMHIMKDGTVGNVRILGSSGDAEWDSMAAQSMKQWRYSTPRQSGTPVDLWMRQLVIVQIQQPIMRILGALVSSSKREADSLYALLEGGTKFETLAKHEGVESSAVNGKYLGSVDISSYPRPVREELRKLREDEVSRPVRIGEKYIIYKRFKQDPSTAVPQ